MKKLLKLISKHSSHQRHFAELKNNVTYYITSGRKIPEHCICYPKYKKLKDGFYRLNKYICSGNSGCRIGKPSPKCVKDGIVNSRQCGKYVLDKITNFLLSTEDLKNIVKDF